LVKVVELISWVFTKTPIRLPVLKYVCVPVTFGPTENILYVNTGVGQAI